MSVMSVSEVYSRADTPESTASKTVMGKEDFLTLLVAQLQNQDPLNPTDSTDFTAQLAQFSSLEQLQNLNETISGFTVYQSTLNNIQMSSFIGKTITATGNSLSVEDGAPTDIAFDLKSGASSVYIQIYDSAGTFVADINAGALSSGLQTVQWDGTSNSGIAVNDGIYTFSVMAVDGAGKAVSSTSYVTGTVTGVDYTSGETMLILGDRSVPVASMVRVANPSQVNAES